MPAQWVLGLQKYSSTRPRAAAMSVIFISHSSRDKAWAERIATWLRQEGYAQLFLDSDAAAGIAAGTSWRDTLVRRLRQSQAMLVLCSPHYLASQWCLSELAMASQLCKHLYPLRIASGELPSLVQPIQAIDLVDDPEGGLQRLSLALASQLHWKDRLPWDNHRPPYPGLMACQEADAALFFGRDRELEELDRRLRSLRQAGRSLLLVLGASGCGKSSLLRAGILPRLRLEPSTWLVLDPFRPGADDPFEELALSLNLALRARDQAEAPEAPRRALDLQTLFSRLRRAHDTRDATVVVPIDQFEELLAGGGEAFLAMLAQLLEAEDGRLLVIATLRSDYLGSLQLHPSAVAGRADQFLLNPMRPEGILEVIEAPAARVDLGLEPGLSLRMTEDTRSGDALPLLALTLWELWKAHGAEGRLTLQHYEAFGGLEKAVERVAQEALQGSMVSDTDRRALRDAFIPALVRLGEQGFSRRPARWSELPVAARPLLEQLINRRLLVRRGDDDRSMMLEVAHEALLRNWPLLRDWLEESRVFLGVYAQLRDDVALWQAAPQRQRSQWLLSPGKLNTARRWLRDRPEAFATEIRDFIRASARQQRRSSQGQRAAIATVSLLLITALIRLHPVLYARAMTLVARVSGQPALITQALAAVQEQRWQELAAVAANRLPSCAGETGRRSAFCHSERQIVQLVELERAPYSLMALQRTLRQEAERGHFGGWKPTDAPEANFDDIRQRFQPGALQLTALMLYDKRAVGADRNGDGAISDRREAWMIPCELLERLAALWKSGASADRQRQGRFCHLFRADGAGDEDPGCNSIDNGYAERDPRRLSAKTLAFWLFAPNTDVMQQRHEACQQASAAPKAP